MASERQGDRRTALLLELILLVDTGVEEDALGLVFRFNDNSRVATLAIVGLLTVSSAHGVRVEAR